MLKTPVHQSGPARSLFFLGNAFVSGQRRASLPLGPGLTPQRKWKSCFVRFLGSNIIRAVANAEENSVTVQAIVTVKLSVGGLLATLGLDKITDLVGKIRLELVSEELDPKTGLEKNTIKGSAHRVSKKEEDVMYESDFVVPQSFGNVGAVLVENGHHKEMLFENIVLNGFPNGSINIVCNSWVHTKFDNPEKRIFFTNKSYLPSQTPSGLKRLRGRELENVRGNGKGERKSFERIYDYDTYNDIGDPDNSQELVRPVLGGEKHPYPRRCRTGRGPSEKDTLSEKRSSSIYVPRDEEFSELKTMTFIGETLSAGLDALIPQIRAALTDTDLGFPSFTDIDSLYSVGMTIPKLESQGLLNTVISRVVNSIEGSNQILRFKTPKMIDRDKFSWLRDEEFARQTLAGVNPFSIKLVTEWPLKSELDSDIYGPPESAITKELIEGEMRAIMTVDEAIKLKKIFVIDYHDLLLPYVNKVREIEGTTLYGSRTLFFLTPDNTLRPLAIELTRPPKDDKAQWKQVFTPSSDPTGNWIWRLAKAHVLAHESGYHELVIHWLRTHCCTEPYIIAANRQLSAMHPIYRLLNPHFRYTMKINALARLALINAGGIIESSFSTEKYSMELSSVAYDKFWRFDMEALPADLIRRGMAVEDPTAEHGLKLTIKDYPFADDGLLVWTATKEWVSDYVNHYYPDSKLVESDQELQAWWTEVRTKGHGDKKDEPWWPLLKTQEDLTQTLTTIIWVASCHHAATNFGQYTYGGYFPNRPTIARTNMPTENPSEQDLKKFLEKPEFELLQSLPSQIQATTVMTVLDVLSTHSPDEEYLGGKMESSWAENPAITDAFEQFNEKLKNIQGIIHARNTDMNLKNRTGAGIVPYELLKPFSDPGMTGMGVPNSISI